MRDCYRTPERRPAILQVDQHAHGDGPAVFLDDAEHSRHVVAVRDHDVRRDLHPEAGGGLDRGGEGVQLSRRQFRGGQARGLDGGEFLGRRAEHGEVDPVEPGRCALGEDGGPVLAIAGESDRQAEVARDADEVGEFRVEGGLAAGEVDFCCREAAAYCRECQGEVRVGRDPPGQEPGAVGGEVDRDAAGATGRPGEVAGLAAEVVRRDGGAFVVAEGAGESARIDDLDAEGAVRHHRDR
ncbi:hypothetical protein ADL22_07570 [Streptomyces sp. NRRL F-4489]|nr:hypothetical protein ADL22_07570 [Streptomyces sp. NRRL F-4489]